MITLCVILLVLGIVLLAVEIFMPGFGIFGVCGLLALIFSAVLTAMFIPYGWLLIVAEVVLLGAAFYGALRYIKKRQLYGKLIMDETLREDTSEIGDMTVFMGKEGIAKTPLRPFGSVDFNGAVLEVSAGGAFIDAGTRVKVVEVQKHKLRVETLRQQQ